MTRLPIGRIELLPTLNLSNAGEREAPPIFARHFQAPIAKTRTRDSGHVVRERSGMIGFSANWRGFFVTASIVINTRTLISGPDDEL